MKVVVALAAAVTICACNTIPVPRDNSHYVEGESRYIWMEGDEGEPRLVDLQEPLNEAQTVLASKSGANNQYWLFTRNNPTTPQILIADNHASILNSNYDPSKPINVIAHGWTNSGHHLVNKMLTEAFLAIADVNIIVVDWSTVAALNYPFAVIGIPDVGQHVGQFLTYLINTVGGHWNNVHLIGYSLGAHVVGNAGRATGGLPSRITGLDPAGPLWQTNSNTLSANDAQYVEAIHTDGLYQGIYRPIGDADFYPNGGINPMPGCTNSHCSHARAYEYFAASIYYNHLEGKACQSIAEAGTNQCQGSSFNMGNSILTKRGSGIYGLSTAPQWPY